jgi:RNA polymerase sigma-70 factor (ECF subfamily)
MDEAALPMVQTLLETQAAALALFARTWCDTPEDVVQDSLLKLARQSPLPEQPIAWMYQAVRRRAITVGRAESRRRKRETATAHSTDWFLSSLDDALDARTAADALHDLPAELREVVVARLWGQLSFQEIADLVGCSSSAAHRRYVSGLTALRQRLGIPCPNPNSSHPS